MTRARSLRRQDHRGLLRWTFPFWISPLWVVLAGVLCAATLPPGDARDSGEEEIAELRRQATEISRDIEAIRDETFDHPVEVRVADENGFRELVEDFTRDMLPPEQIAADETVAKLLGLVEPDVDLLELSLDAVGGAVVGLYDPRAEAFYVKTGVSSGVAGLTMAHELTHALDDQLYDLSAGLEERKHDTDAQMAYHAVVEGSGMAVMTRWIMGHATQIDPAEMKEASSMGAEALADVSPYIWKPLAFSYIAGQAFLARTTDPLVAQLKSPKPADYRSAFARPPRSTEQLLHPEKYWDPEQADEPIDVVIDAGELPTGWSLRHQDTLGELGLAIVSELPEERTGLADPLVLLQPIFTHDAARGWGGDRYALLERDGAQLLLLVSTWDDEDEALEFHERTVAVGPHIAKALVELRAWRAQEEPELADVPVAHGAVLHGRDVLLYSGLGVSHEEARKTLDALRYRLVPDPSAEAAAGDAGG